MSQPASVEGGRGEACRDDGSGGGVDVVVHPTAVQPRTPASSAEPTSRCPCTIRTNRVWARRHGVPSDRTLLCPKRCARARGNPRPVPLRSAYWPGAWQQHRRPDRAVGRVQRARPGPDHEVLLRRLRAGDAAGREPVGHPLRGSRGGAGRTRTALPRPARRSLRRRRALGLRRARCLAVAAHGDHDRGRARASARLRPVRPRRCGRIRRKDSYWKIVQP